MSVNPDTQGNNIYLPPSPVVQPFLTISNITQAKPCVVTVIEENTYIAGKIVYFSVPSSYGMYQIDGLSGEIILISGQNFTINIDTSAFSAFAVPSSQSEVIKPATLSPAGSRNLYNFTTVPFQSLGNFGN